jgi:type II secretory pathway pseudopilin PulG
MIKQLGNQAAFTIVELMTVMSVIILLIGLLVPGLNQVKRYSMKVEQMNQFHAIAVGLETFSAEWDGYPPSSVNTDNFCGAMKLCEAMVGLDLGGYKPGTKFDLDLLADPKLYNDTDKSDRRSYLKADQASAYSLADIYDPGVIEGMDTVFVLCDSYRRFATSKRTGKSIGMPVLYYKANSSNPGLDVYNYADNWPVVKIARAWYVPPTDPAFKASFYDAIKDPSISAPNERAYRSDTFLLQSAGFDGQYGTADDIFNFVKK